MKLALASGGKWFFFALIFLTLILGSSMGKSDDIWTDLLLPCAGISFVIAGARFFYVWEEYEERKLKQESRT